jgi:hypothetical protein
MKTVRFRISLLAAALLGLAVARCMAVTSPARTVTITLFLEVDHKYEVTFDAERISEAQVRAFFTLDEQAWQEFYSGGPFIDDYRDPDFPASVMKSVWIGEQRLRSLDSLNYPAVLTPVFEWVRSFVGFQLWKTTILHAVYTPWNVQALEGRYEDRTVRIEPRAECAKVLDSIRKAESKEQQDQLVRHDWNNCAVRAWHRQAGPYPGEAWKQFLEEYGIHVKEFEYID